MINILHKLDLFWVKNAIKNITSVPGPFADTQITDRQNVDIQIIDRKL
jgi:hypothetical protein